MRVKPIMKKLAYSLFIIGLCLILFPIVREWHYDWKQERLLTEWGQTGPQVSTVNSEQQLAKSNDKLTQLFVNSISDEEPTQKPAANSESKPSFGIIEIAKIKLKLPIMEGATNENMKFAAAHLSETNKLGEIGNAAIAAHRARTKGRLFNRLNEIEVGDEITVKQKDQQFVYTVFKVSRVKPTDISVLGRNDKDSILTLITCDPLVNPTHRLIVQAKL